MITHLWTVLCSKSSIDKETNNVSLFSVIEQVTISGPTLPQGQTGLVPMEFELVILWYNSPVAGPQRGHARILFKDSSDNTLSTFEFDADVTSSRRHRTTAKVNGLPFREPGTYRFLLQLNLEGETEFKDIISYPLDISFQPTP
jgi:hypothetical protein